MEDAETGVVPLNNPNYHNPDPNDLHDPSNLPDTGFIYSTYWAAERYLYE
jgi:hypothetical protein